MWQTTKLTGRNLAGSLSPYCYTVNLPVLVVTWYEIPDIWWETVERLSWMMLGKPAAYGYQFRPVPIAEYKS